MGDEKMVTWQKWSTYILWKFVIAFIPDMHNKVFSLLHPVETFLFNIFGILRPGSTVSVTWLQKDEHYILATVEKN